MVEPDSGAVVAPASQVKRFCAYVLMVIMGAVLIYTALAQPPALHWAIFLLVSGAALLWLAERLRKATQHGLLLTQVDLRDTSGKVIARLDDIRQIDRGALALKPTHGFTLLLTTRQQAGWAPGMWWRFGKRVGVGGVTAAAPVKKIAERITLFLQQRDG